MARLPTLDDLGSRPVPVSRRSISSNSRAGAVGGAAAALGNQLFQTGAGMLKEQGEREDRLAYASAKSALLKADIATRKELSTDPDYETWESRYSERMTAARAEAAGLIRSRGDKALFEQDAELDVMRGSAELAKGAFARRVDTETASVKEQLFGLHDLAQSATDEASREAVIGNASELIAGAQAKGYISAEQAGALRRDWTQNYVVQRIETLRDAEDYDGALKFFEANRGRLDSGTEIRTASLLSDAVNNRETLILAQEFVGGTAFPVSGSPVPVRSRKADERAVESELSGAGYSSAVVAGFLGNFDAEGGYSGAQGDGGSASGIAQWREGRRDNFRKMFGKDPHDASKSEQAKFVVWEMQNPGKAGMTVAQRDAILAADTPEEAAALIDQNYERSSGKHRTRRQQAAREYHGGVSNHPSGQRSDLGKIYASIDERAAAEGWTPEKIERVKDQSARLVQREDNLINREQSDAYENALAKAETLGEEFTDPSQLGDAYYRASETQQRTLRNMAEANSKVTAAPANGEAIRALHIMAVKAPDEFAGFDLRPYRAFMTPGEFDEISVAQAKASENVGKWSPRTGVQTAMTWGEKFGGVKITDDTHRYRVYRYIEDRARQFRDEEKGRTPGENDYTRWFREAVSEVKVTRSFLDIDVLAPDTSRRSFATISPAFRNQIVRNFRSVNGRDPSEQEIEDLFERMGEAIE